MIVSFAACSSRIFWKDIGFRSVGAKCVGEGKRGGYVRHSLFRMDMQTNNVDGFWARIRTERPVNQPTNQPTNQSTDQPQTFFDSFKLLASKHHLVRKSKTKIHHAQFQALVLFFILSDRALGLQCQSAYEKQNTHNEQRNASGKQHQLYSGLVRVC